MVKRTAMGKRLRFFFKYFSTSGTKVHAHIKPQYMLSGEDIQGCRQKVARGDIAIWPQCSKSNMMAPLISGAGGIWHHVQLQWIKFDGLSLIPSHLLTYTCHLLKFLSLAKLKFALKGKVGSSPFNKSLIPICYAIKTLMGGTQL